jgi:hypothetical protein
MSPALRSSRRFWLACAAVLLALMALAGAGAAQATHPAAAADSAAIDQEARAAQREFENERRAYLPTELDDGRGPCDATIGRFCYWYRPADEPDEPDRIGVARLLLLARLDDAARALPTDDWIAAQRVRYLVEHRWADTAVAAARECRGTRWWCLALEGYARHGLRDYAGADSVYAAAIGAMPPAERCRWNDLSTLLADGDARRYRRLTCAQRQAANQRIWWLAQPFYSVPGHDLRTEYYARLTMTRMLRNAASPHDLAWGDDLTELVVRYGWPTWWTRPFTRAGAVETPAALGHEPTPSFWFFAEPSVPDSAGRDRDTAPRWDFSRERPPSRYAPPYARSFGEIRNAQVARFRRDQKFLVVGAFDLRQDTLFAFADPKVAVSVARDARTSPTTGPALFPWSTGIIGVTAPWSPAIVSIEAREDDDRRAARLRALFDRPSDWLSDLLLFVPGEELPDSAEAALLVSLRGYQIPKGGRVGLFWETYGEPARDSMDVEVKVVRGAGRRPGHPALGRTECAPAGKASVAVRWRDAAAPSGPRARAVTVDLSALKTGRYVVAIAMSGTGGSACTSRDIEVVSR